MFGLPLSTTLLVFRFPVFWLYLNGRDVVHITQKTASQNQKAYLGEPAAGGGGNIDHLAFRCTGLAQMKARLDGAGAEYKERRVDDQALYQIFLHDPNGIKIELNFAAAEAEGLRAPVMAADLDA